LQKPPATPGVPRTFVCVRSSVKRSMKANDESHLTAGHAAPISPGAAAMLPECIANTDQPGQTNQRDK
jgi:hypothetical protein